LDNLPQKQKFMGKWHDTCPFFCPLTTLNFVSCCTLVTREDKMNHFVTTSSRKRWKGTWELLIFV
jgi:hypothetical protein